MNNFLSVWLKTLLVVLVVCVNAESFAAAPPDAGQMLRDSRRDAVLPAPPSAPSTINAPEQAHPAPPSGADDVRVKVTRFTFNGNLALSEDILRAAVVEYENKPLNFGELVSAVEKVEALYKKEGYFLAQAYLAPQKIKDGSIEINISEGFLGQSRLEGESRTNPNVIYAYLDQLPKGRAVKLVELERQIMLINDLAGSSASLDLQASEEPGRTDLVLAQKMDPLLSGRIELDNYGMPSTGKNRVAVFLNANSPFHLGDRLSGNLMRSDNGNLVSYGLNYALPVGSSGLQLTAGTSLSEYSLGGAFANLNGSGTVHSYRVGTSYPVVRSRAVSLNLKLDVAHNDLLDRILATKVEKSSDVITATAASDWTDEWAGGGANRAELAVTGGYLNGGATSGTKGGYDKAIVTLQRDQNIRPHLTMSTQLTHQQAGKNLDSSEKFSVGGPTTMPGYASGEASGDNGTLVRLKLTYRIGDNLSAGAFVDYAHIQAVFDPAPSSSCHTRATVTGNNCHFSDVGVSLDWLGSSGLAASLIMAWAGSEVPNPKDNDRPRIWINIGYLW